MPNIAKKAALKRGAIFFDRDGTIIHDARYLDRAEDVELLPGVRETLHQAYRTHQLFLFSNQSGISRGYFTWEEVDAVNKQMLKLLERRKPLFKASCMAADHPERPYVYRKPSPRFILECIDQFDLDPAKCWMVGDRLTDLQAGVRAGVRAILVSTGEPIETPTRNYLRQHSIPAFDSLAEVVAYIQQAAD